MVKIGGRDVPSDLVVIAAGVLAFIFGFIDFFSKSGYGISGYESGFLGSFAIALSLFVGLIVAGRLFAGLTFNAGNKYGPAVITFGLSLLAAIFILIKLLVGYKVGGVSLDRSVGLWLTFVVIIVQAVFAFLSVASSGEKLPEFGRGTSSGSTA
ncbi:MAG TPA: hypothetical protein VHC41_02935 [Mycobacteriales bacterium]|jgi:hypothetical protein|nr:hypothetical protein [Mycobacteriales bacterium]